MTSGSRDRRFRLLLMSVGSQVGTAVLECLEALGRGRFELFGMNSEAGAVNNFRTDVCYLSPRAVEERALHALLDDLVTRHAPDLIIPTRDDDVVTLARWAQGRSTARAMVGSVAMAEIIRDKWTSHEWARRHGLPFARSAIDAEGIDRLRNEVGFPLISKPRKGFGSNGVRILLDDEHLRNAVSEDDQVIQEAIDPAPRLTPESLRNGIPLWFAPIQPGSPLGLCLLDDAGARLLATWGSRHVRGAAIDTVLMRDPGLEQLSLAYGRAAWEDGWRGLLSLQARRSASGAWVPIELAGRFMGGTNALHMLGVPVVSDVLAQFIPGFDVLAPAAPLFDARAVKQATTHVVRHENESTLLSSGMWQRV